MASVEVTLEESEQMHKECLDQITGVTPYWVAPTASLCSGLVKCEPPKRSESCYVLYYTELVTVTKEEDIMQGAVLISLEFADEDSGAVCDTEVWIPKKLCSNLREDDKTIYVWDQFFKSKIVDIKVNHGLVPAFELTYYKDSIYG